MEKEITDYTHRALKLYEQIIAHHNNVNSKQQQQQQQKQRPSSPLKTNIPWQLLDESYGRLFQLHYGLAAMYHQSLVSCLLLMLMM